MCLLLVRILAAHDIRLQVWNMPWCLTEGAHRIHKASRADGWQHECRSKRGVHHHLEVLQQGLHHNSIAADTCADRARPQSSKICSSLHGEMGPTSIIRIEQHPCRVSAVYHLTQTRFQARVVHGLGLQDRYDARMALQEEQLWQGEVAASLVEELCKPLQETRFGLHIKHDLRQSSGHADHHTTAASPLASKCELLDGSMSGLNVPLDDVHEAKLGNLLLQCMQGIE
mmetsp:Transcript_72382/g.233966  ORF Transcript_72382/g.233966 Transcript_72382/m.233966 type:complete len:228 (-) Transcript_72382:910-1593(-)